MFPSVSSADAKGTSLGATAQRPLDRRARGRQETTDHTLRISCDVMTEEGVNALSLAEIARRLGVQPPSLYKYFDSLLDVYDALFRRAMIQLVEVMGTAMSEAEPGLPALEAG